MNDVDRWGEDRSTSPALKRDRRGFNPVLAAAMLMLGIVILVPAARVAYLFLSSGSLFSGSGYAKVTGNVKYKGQPLPSGKITFVGAEGTEPGIGEIMNDGSFTVQAPPIGDNIVTVITESVSTAGPNPFSKRRVVVAPTKYRSVETSPLTLRIRKGMNQFDPDLTDN